MIRLKCFLPAWISAWAVAVFLPSALIAWFGLSKAAAALGRSLPGTVWQVADDVGPLVKLTIGGLLLAFFLVLEKRAPTAMRYPLAIGIGTAAMLVAIALVPAGYSRGFAAALSGTRFDPMLTALYLIGGVASGLAFAATSDRCRRRR